MPALTWNQERVACRGCGWLGIRIRPGTRGDGKEDAQDKGFGLCRECGQDDLVTLKSERDRIRRAKARMALAEHGEGMMDASERGRLLEMGERLKGTREGAQSPVSDKEFWRCLGILMCEVAVVTPAPPGQKKVATAGKGAQAHS